MYTREEFEELRRRQAERMAADAGLRRKALDVLAQADRYHWIHQTTWFGQPILNLPQDVLALQEIIFRTRPRFIVECGVAWGGSLLMYSTLMEVLGGERIFGIDIYIPPDLRERLGSHGTLSERIRLIEGSSTAPETVGLVKDELRGSRDVLVILDSNHSHEHVLAELQAYAPLVGIGHYVVCSDTIVEQLPPQTHRPRPWGPGNNPRTAVDQFLRADGGFEVDKALENKLLFTCNPHGYLRRARPDSIWINDR